jgi:hypothetical protein
MMDVASLTPTGRAQDALETQPAVEHVLCDLAERRLFGVRH